MNKGNNINLNVKSKAIVCELTQKTTLQKECFLLETKDILQDEAELKNLKECCNQYAFEMKFSLEDKDQLLVNNANEIMKNGKSLLTNIVCLKEIEIRMEEILSEEKQEDKKYKDKKFVNTKIKEFNENYYYK